MARKNIGNFVNSPACFDKKSSNILFLVERCGMARPRSMLSFPVCAELVLPEFWAQNPQLEAMIL